MDIELPICKATSLRKIVIVDDDAKNRESLGSQLANSDLQPILQEKPLPSTPEASVSLLRQAADALLCDHHLTLKKPYATFHGAAVVAASFDQNFPAVLCSRDRSADHLRIRAYRSKIPVMMPPEELDPDSLVRALEYWLQERRGAPSPARRLHPVQLRVEDLEYDDDEPTQLLAVYVLIAGWKPEIVRIQSTEMPADVLNAFVAGPKKYLHASVNIGASRLEDLYFSDWEPE